MHNMKYVKLFEDFSALADFGTLRDFVDPDNFADEEDTEAYETSIDAAIRTLDFLGIGVQADPETEELERLGIVTPEDLIARLPLDRAVCIYNSNGHTYQHDPALMELVKRFPELLSWSEDWGGLEMAEAAAQVSGETFSGELSYDNIEVWLYRDQAGNEAVEWRGYDWTGIFMLDTLLQNK